MSSSRFFSGRGLREAGMLRALPDTPRLRACWVEGTSAFSGVCA